MRGLKRTDGHAAGTVYYAQLTLVDATRARTLSEVAQAGFFDESWKLGRR